MDATYHSQGNIKKRKKSDSPLKKFQGPGYGHITWRFMKTSGAVV